VKLLKLPCFVMLAMLFAAARPAVAQFFTIDDPNTGPNSTVLNGINNNGIAVGWYFGTTGAQRIFTYNINTQTYTTIPDAAGFSGFQPFGINDNGDISGQCSQSGTFQIVGFIRSGSTGTLTPVLDTAGGPWLVFAARWNQ
jgi:hypothetical protein